MTVMQQVRHPYIAQRATVHGGEPIIRGTRVPVRTVVQYVLQQGFAPEALVKEFPHLSLAAVYDALSFYYDHRSLLDRLIREQTETAWRQ